VRRGKRARPEGPRSSQRRSPTRAALRDTGLTSAVALVRGPARAAGLLTAAGRLGMVVDPRRFDSGICSGDLLVSMVPSGAADFAPNDPGVPAPTVRRARRGVRPLAHPARAGRRHVGAVVVSGFDLLPSVIIMCGNSPDRGCRLAPLACVKPSITPQASVARCRPGLYGIDGALMPLGQQRWNIVAVTAAGRPAVPGCGAGARGSRGMRESGGGCRAGAQAGSGRKHGPAWNQLCDRPP